jgi:DHA1 family tetracycline resistance protein-like MFS transporter
LVQHWSFSLYCLANTVYLALWSFVFLFRYDCSEGQIGLSLGIYGVSGAL